MKELMPTTQKDFEQKIADLTAKHNIWWVSDGENWNATNNGDFTEELWEMFKAGQAQALKMVEDLLPNDAGFTDRFYELLKQRKGE